MPKPKFGTDLTLTHQRSGDESQFVVEAFVTPGHPGRLTGPPEDCYPAEGPEVDDLTLSKFDHQDETGKDHYTPVPESEWEQWGVDHDYLSEVIVAYAEAYWQGAKEDADEARAERQRERLYEDPSDDADSDGGDDA